MRLFFIVLLAAVVSTHAQTPQVPHKMEFGGLTLTIREDARREIQKDVNALTQSPRHHNIKVERAKTYFPLIEKVFQEERIPEDFKYLVLQESALIADAVSVSNAVGFWQFKDFTAVEMGLRVDKEVDERLNIVSSSRAAARYIKKNNFHFNNWLFALQAYQMGAGGAMKALPKNLSGARNMEITSATYWYVKKFLAHKVAFEDAVKGDGQIKAIPYLTTGKKSLSDVAREVSINEDEIREYNKWAKKGHIPDDRSYTVIIPLIGEGKNLQLPEPVVASVVSKPVSSPSEEVMAERTTINGIRAIKPKAGESVASLAGRAKISLKDFLMWNDLSQSSSLDSNQYYLLSKKRKRADKAYHQVKEGESLWMISQNHGVEMKRLMRFNRLKRDEEITAGTTLWLSSKKPKNADQNVEQGEVIEIDNSTSFAWASSSNQTDPTTEVATPVVDNMQDKSTTQAPGSSTTVLESTPNLIDSVETLQVTQVASTVRDSAEDIAIPIKNPAIKRKDHVVQQKETLYGIAKQYSVGVMELVEWNDLNLQDGIRPGQILRLSDPDAVQPEPTASILIEHEVKTTDTLYGIARRYGVTIQQLMEWNDKKDFTLAIGEKLKIQGR